MIDVAESVFCAVCKEANLFARNGLINKELAQGDRTENTFKNLKLCSDHIQLTMKANLGHHVVLSGSNRPLQRENKIYAEISETTRVRIGR